MRRLLFIFAFCQMAAICAVAQSQFSAMEQQKISIETPGLFEQSDAFTVDFSLLKPNEYSFPLPVGKAEARKDYNVEITSTKGDAVKAMFDGVVRMSWNHPKFGKVIVVRHDNGLETVYGRNVENRVKVGDHVKAGQTIAIIGGEDGRVYCEFAVMVNGARINPDMILDLKMRRLRQKTIMCRLEGTRVRVTTVEPDPWDVASRTKNEDDARLKASDPFNGGSKFTLNLSAIPEGQWCYPLPGAKVISPYGGRGGRQHTGTDLKTKPNDPIFAAFEGVVTMSQVFYGYGNCIVIRHDNGLETLYSHNSKNLVNVGDRVKCGQKIALTGRTGRATTEHLHFEVRVGGKPYNSNMIFDHNTHKLLSGSVTFHKNQPKRRK
jgi:murein DD-endopeptidase MepM/ murein hydrolase activator NlpD